MDAIIVFASRFSMPINAGYEYFNAEKAYYSAVTMDEKIRCLEEMIRAAPKHKSSENFVAELKQRLKKMLEKVEKAKKVGAGKKGLRKEGFQFVLVGKANSGKSLLISNLTNAKPLVTQFPFATRTPEIGTFEFGGVKAQVVDVPSIGSEYFDVGLVHTADCVLIVVEQFDDYVDVEKIVSRSHGKKIFVFNKSDLLTENEFRKLTDKIKSKKLNGVIVSSVSGDGIEDLKKKMFGVMGVIRIFMKEPGKQRTTIPAVLKKGASVRNVAEAIYKGFSKTVKEVRLTGPSGKFPNQKVGLDHKVEDMDVVEFHTR